MLAEGVLGRVYAALDKEGLMCVGGGVSVVGVRGSYHWM